jgi:hypothetical protein
MVSLRQKSCYPLSSPGLGGAGRAFDFTSRSDQREEQDEADGGGVAFEGRGGPAGRNSHTPARGTACRG